MTKEIRAINRWLKKEGNNKALLAAKLGYSSSSSITMWIKRDRVPDYQKQKLKEILI